MRALLAVVLLLTLTIPTSEANAQGYRRNRTAAQGAYQRNAGYSPYQQQGYYPGFSPFTPFVAGSWYTRPYPYHLDYHQVRSRATPACCEVPHLAVPELVAP